MKLKQSTKVLILVGLGLSLATFGVILYTTFPIIMESQIKDKLILKKGTVAYSYWENIPVPIYLRFYFFNITNPQEVYDNLSTPIVEELGPYTFRESREKTDIYWKDDGTMTYRQVKKWYYQPDLTTGSLTDVITTINVPMVAASAMAKKMDSFIVYTGMSFMFAETHSTWFIRKPVHELLFDGYEDPLIDQARVFANIPYDKFGWFYQRNGTDDGEFNIFTGMSGFDHFAEVNTWNGVKNVTAYNPPCNDITGSAGDLWPPFLKEGGKVELFVTDICRTLGFRFLEKRTINNMEVNRYWADNLELDNGQKRPENKCFCLDDHCYPTGAVDVKRCKFDAPAVVSYPHFLYADSIYSKSVIGLKPDPEKHMMYIDIQKDMGIPLSVAARMQINIVMEKVKHLPQFSNITRKMYIPAIWFSETADVDDTIANQLKLVVYTLPIIVSVMSFFLIGLGTILVIAALILAFINPNKNNVPPTTQVKNEIPEEQKPLKNVSAM